MGKTKRLARQAARKIRPKRDHVRIAGSVIPSPDRRWCGPEFKDDGFYLASTESEAQRLVDHLQCGRASRILDIGCGQGRLAIGILRVIGDLDYLGLDVDGRSIEWCLHHIEGEHRSFKFRRLDLYNERYSPQGQKIGEGFRFDAADGSADIAYLYSVFSHMTEPDMQAYLTDLARVLDADGKLFLTTFVEEGVPPVAVNPGDYRVSCSGPLHVVRYEKNHLFSIVAQAGFSVTEFSYATEADGQSALYLKKSSG